MKITILLATFNRAHLIGETLNSIIAQTYENWKCIIVDDHSSDNTAVVVNEYVQKDARFSYFLKTGKYKKGLSGTRNYGLDLAAERSAQYIQFFDDDDLMHPKKLELQIVPFLKDANLNFTVCKFEKLVQKEGIPTIEKPELQLAFPHLGNAILTGQLKMNSLGPLWRMGFINQFRFDETLRYAEEWELYTRIGYQFPNNYAVVDEYLFQYRKHQHTLTLGRDEDYERRKTSFVIRIKIFEFLTDNKLHTQKSIIFLANTFLVYSYNPFYVKQLLQYVQQNHGFSKRLILFLKTGISMGKIYRKVITKLAAWV